jgi:O-antigen/teichoic acid export membrane protein
MIGRKSLLSVTSRFFVRVLEGIVYLIAVNQFLPVQFGYRQIATSSMAFFSFISILGFATVHLKTMAETENQNESFTIFFLIKVFLILVSTIIIVLIVLNQIRNGLISNESEQKWILLIVFFDRFLASFYQIYEVSFRAKMKIAKLEIPFLIGSFCGILFSLGSILFFRNFIFYLFGLVVTNSIRLMFSIKYGKMFHLTKINFNLLGKYVAQSIIFLIPITLNTLILNIGPFFFLRYFDEELLGIYTVLSGFFLLIMELEFTLRLLLLPNFTTLLSKNNLNALKATLNLFEKYMIILNGVIIIAGVIFAEFFLNTFLGVIYYEKGRYFFYGSLLFLVKFPLFEPYLSLIIAGKKLKLFASLSIFNFIFQIISWVFFIPNFNIIAIDMGSWIFTIPQILIIRIYCEKNFKVGKCEKKDWGHLTILLFLIITSFLVAQLNLRFIYSGTILVIILGIYMLCLFSTKILGKKDIEFLRDMLNPKKMMGYVKEEVFEKET